MPLFLGISRSQNGHSTQITRDWLGSDCSSVIAITPVLVDQILHLAPAQRTVIALLGLAV
jgi:hypothetical protein